MNKQGGFSIVMAIFILVVLGLLGGYMATFTAVQTDTTAYALQGAKAYQAARAGIEWALAQINTSNSCTLVNAQTALTFNGLNGFTVSLSCIPQTVYEGGNTLTYFSIDAKSQYQTYSNSNYVAREIKVSIIQ
jgi:MSHA biogenesis protein MshP